MTRKSGFLTSAALLAATASGTAGAALLTGDIAFTSFNADEDGWALVTFKDIAANTTIYFTDNEWDGSMFNTGEALRTWDTGGSTIQAGTVVRFSAVDTAGATVTYGTLTQTGDTGLNATAETVYAYLGPNASTPTTFLGAVTSLGNASEITPAGLTAGTNGVVLTASTDFAQYTGPRSGLTTFAAYAPFVNNPANWSIIVGGSNELAIPDLTAFTVVPVPAAAWLLGSGLAALVGLRARARR
jgi:hypothetical protein